MARAAARRFLLEVKAAQEDIDAIDELAAAAGVSRADMIRTGLDVVLRGISRDDVLAYVRAARLDGGRQGQLLRDATVTEGSTDGQAVDGAGGPPAAGSTGVAVSSGAGHQTGDASVLRLLEAMPTAFFSFDLDWRFSYINAAAESLLGAPRDTFLGARLWDLFPQAVGSVYDHHYNEAIRTGQPVTFEAYYDPPLDSWFEVRVWPGPDGLAVYLDNITLRRAAEHEAAGNARRAALMARVTSQLTETMDAEEALASLTQLMVPALAEWAVITFVDDRGRIGADDYLKDVGYAHADPDAELLVKRYVELRLDSLRGRTLLRQALRGGEVLGLDTGATEAMLANHEPGEARDLLHQLAPESIYVFALRGRGHTTGVITLLNGAGRGPIPPEDLTLAQEIAARAGLALDNMRLYREQRQLAAELQTAMLTDPVQPEHLEIAVRYVPAAQVAQVGGDWYDAFLQPSGATTLVIGDVIGHDTSAAASMGQLRSLLRGIAVTTQSAPGELLSHLDRAMLTLRADVMATAVVASIEHHTTDSESHAAPWWQVCWSNAGHPPPMAISPSGVVETLEASTPNLLLGVTANAERTTTSVALTAGTTLFFCTDGLVERRDQPVKEGMARLATALADLAGRDLEGLCDAVLEEMLTANPEDDVAVVAVRLGGTSS